MKNFLQLLWWNDVNVKPNDNREVLVIRKGRFFTKSEVQNSSFLSEDAVAWAYIDTKEVSENL